jgi:hypothetical protein
MTSRRFAMPGLIASLGRPFHYQEYFSSPLGYVGVF